MKCYDKFKAISLTCKLNNNDTLLGPYRNETSLY